MLSGLVTITWREYQELVWDMSARRSSQWAIQLHEVRVKGRAESSTAQQLSLPNQAELSQWQQGIVVRYGKS